MGGDGRWGSAKDIRPGSFLDGSSADADFGAKRLWGAFNEWKRLGLGSPEQG